MHDYFEILGIPENALASEVRRACARRVRRSHPDFCVSTGGLTPSSSLLNAKCQVALEIAVDFVDAASFVDRMHTAFFADPE